MNVVEERENAPVNEFRRVVVFREDFLQFFDFFVHGSKRWRDGVCPMQESGEQSPFVFHRNEWFKICVNSWKRLFSMDGGRESVSVAIDVNIQKWKDLVNFFLVREFNVGVFWRQILWQNGYVSTHGWGCHALTTSLTIACRLRVALRCVAVAHSLCTSNSL